MFSIYWVLTHPPPSQHITCFSLMASFTKTAHLSLTLFFLHIFSPLPVHARGLTSFSKAVAQNEFPSDTPTKTQEFTTPVAAAGGEQPVKLPPLGRIGYGLYGRAPNEYFPTTTSSSTNYYNGFIGERSRSPRTEFNAESYDSRETNPAYKNYGESQKYKEQLDTMIADEADRYGMGDMRAAESRKSFNNLNSQRHGDAYVPAMGGSQGYGVKDGSFGYGAYTYEGKGKGYGPKKAIEGNQNFQNQEINEEENYEP